MTKIGLRATVALLTKGYTKKEIEELAAIDEEQDKTPEPEDKDKTPEPEKQPEDQPDYKAMYEELLKDKEAKDKEIEDKDSQIKELQKDNIHENNLPEIEKQLQEEAASLNEAFKGWY